MAASERPRGLVVQAWGPSQPRRLIHNRETLPADHTLPPGLEEASLTSPAPETGKYQDKVRTCTTVGKMHWGRSSSKGAKRVRVGRGKAALHP